MQLCEHEITFQQIHPNDRWMEQDPLEMLEMVRKCIDEAIAKLTDSTSIIYDRNDIAAVGITNQRETIVVWDKKTGQPLYNAIGKNEKVEMFKKSTAQFSFFIDNI